MHGGVAISIFIGFSETLIGLFLDPNDPQRGQILAAGVSLLFLASVFQLVDGAQVQALGLLRGVLDTRVPLVLAVVSYWLIGVPCGYVLGFVMGYEGVGVWLGLVVGLTVASVLLMLRFWRGKLRELRVEFAAS